MTAIPHVMKAQVTERKSRIIVFHLMEQHHRRKWKAPGPMDADNSSRYNLESCTDFATATRVSRNGTSSMLGKKENLPSPVSSQVGAAACGTSGQLEQCLYCLQDFPVSELIHHVESCPARDDARSKVSQLR